MPTLSIASNSEVNRAWEAVVAYDGRTYYWNSETEEVSWDPPPRETLAAKPAPAVGSITPAADVVGEASLERRRLHRSVLDRSLMALLMQHIACAFAQWRLCLYASMQPVAGQARLYYGGIGSEVEEDEEEEGEQAGDGGGIRGGVLASGGSAKSDVGEDDGDGSRRSLSSLRTLLGPQALDALLSRGSLARSLASTKQSLERERRRRRRCEKECVALAERFDEAERQLAMERRRLSMLMRSHATWRVAREMSLRAGGVGGDAAAAAHAAAIAVLGSKHGGRLWRLETVSRLQLLEKARLEARTFLQAESLAAAAAMESAHDGAGTARYREALKLVERLERDEESAVVSTCMLERDSGSNFERDEAQESAVVSTCMLERDEAQATLNDCSSRAPTRAPPPTTCQHASAHYGALSPQSGSRAPPPTSLLPMSPAPGTARSQPHLHPESGYVHGQREHTRLSTLEASPPPPPPLQPPPPPPPPSHSPPLGFVTLGFSASAAETAPNAAAAAAAANAAPKPSTPLQWPSTSAAAIQPRMTRHRGNPAGGMPSAPAAGSGASSGASPRTSSADVPLDSLQLPSLALPVAPCWAPPVTNGGSSSAQYGAMATPTRGAPSTAPINVPPLPPTQGFTSYRGLEEAFQSQKLEIEKLTALLAGRSPQLAPPPPPPPPPPPLPPAELATPSGVPTPFTQARLTGAEKVPSPDFEYSYL